jgi:hypothetical protein
MTAVPAWDNPFAVRHVRPGAVPYLFAEGQDAAALVRRFADLGRRAAVLGPHGSGKSTLLATLLPAFAAAGHPTCQVTLHDGQRTLPPEAWDTLGRLPADRGVAVIDGYEQLGWLARYRLRSLCGRRGHGLLVTAHRPVGLPVLLGTDVSAAVARRVIAGLRQGAEPPSEAELAARLRDRGGNFREVLFELYDEFERDRPPAAGRLPSHGPFG